MYYAFSFIFFTFIFAIPFTIINKRKNKIMVRLEKFLPADILESNHKQEEKETIKQQKKKPPPQLEKRKYKVNSYMGKWEKKLQHAGIEKTPLQFLTIRVYTILAFFLLFFLVDLRGILLYLAIPVGFFVPVFFVKRKTRKRLEQFSEQLAEALGIIANGMRGGFSFMQALKMVGSEMPDPLGPEFNRTIRDMNYGLSMEEAFQALLDRVPSRELELVINALLIQRTTGGNLGDLLETMQETIRGRVKIKDELRTLTAQVKMSSWIVTLLPPAIALYLNFMNPEYFSPMLNHPIGWFMLGFSVTFMLLGWVLMQKIGRIEV